jgi:hypothetical protein
MSVSRPSDKTIRRPIHMLSAIQEDIRLLRLRADVDDQIAHRRARQLERLARLGYPRRLLEGELK